MDHNRYGVDGLPLACRQADTDPVTGLPLPGIPQTGALDQIGNPYVLPTVLGGIAIFLFLFAVQSGILG